MVDKCEVDGCQYEKTGVCGAHGHEIERRKDLQKEFGNLKKVVWVATALTGMYLLITGASFIYTRDGNQEAVNRDEAILTKVETLTDQMQTLAIKTSQQQGEIKTFNLSIRHTNDSLNTLNSRVEKLIELKLDGGK